jgi:hypothetical protein
MTRSTRDPACVPDLLLERYRLGEMSRDEKEELHRLLASDEGLRARLRALEESDKEIRHRYPPAWLAARIRERLRANVVRPPVLQIGPRFSWRVHFAVAAMAVVVIAVGWRLFGPLYLEPIQQASDSAQHSSRIKGDRLVLFRKTLEGSEVLSNGTRARAGDQVRIGYQAAAQSYGAILSIDGRGTVMRHFPRKGELAEPLKGDGLELLDYTYELDDAPGWEQFYLVYGPEAFPVEPVLEAARARAAHVGADPPGLLTLSAPLEQSSLVLIKEATP